MEHEHLLVDVNPVPPERIRKTGLPDVGILHMDLLDQTSRLVVFPLTAITVDGVSCAGVPIIILLPADSRIGGVAGCDGGHKGTAIEDHLLVVLRLNPIMPHLLPGVGADPKPDLVVILLDEGVGRAGALVIIVAAHRIKGDIDGGLVLRPDASPDAYGGIDEALSRAGNGHLHLLSLTRREVTAGVTRDGDASVIAGDLEVSS